jgi:hypothetical protein
MQPIMFSIVSPKSVVLGQKFKNTSFVCANYRTQVAAVLRAARLLALVIQLPCSMSPLGEN